MKGSSPAMMQLLSFPSSPKVMDYHTSNHKYNSGF